MCVCVCVCLWHRSRYLKEGNFFSGWYTCGLESYSGRRLLRRLCLKQATESPHWGLWIWYQGLNLHNWKDFWVHDMTFVSFGQCSDWILMYSNREGVGHREKLLSWQEQFWLGTEEFVGSGWADAIWLMMIQLARNPRCCITNNALRQLRQQCR